MGRTNFGITNMKRAISSASAYQKARERKNLIDSQDNIELEKPDTYEVSHFDFSKEARVCHIDIIVVSYKRTIDRYVTQDGIKYPIYGEFKEKRKTEKRVLKLTNENLELLDKNDDPLLRRFALYIVESINDDSLKPSWYLKKELEKSKKEELSKVHDEYKPSITSLKDEINKQRRVINDNNKKIDSIKNTILEKKSKKDNFNKKASIINNKVLLILAIIFSLGIYAIVKSKRRRKRYELKAKNLDNNITALYKDIDFIDEENTRFENDIISIKKSLDETIEKKNQYIRTIEQDYNDRINNIQPLPTTVNDILFNDFIQLKDFNGIKHERIIGCYVIRNKENNKCYVGQSKDVYKRICREHFKGTKVNNIIFAEDYYNSKFENRDDLFEVKIIPCANKNELDEKEKSLIGEYDSFNNGYNGTSGNN